MVPEEDEEVEEASSPEMEVTSGNTVKMIRIFEIRKIMHVSQQAETALMALGPIKIDLAVEAADSRRETSPRIISTTATTRIS